MLFSKANYPDKYNKTLSFSLDLRVGEALPDLETNPVLWGPSISNALIPAPAITFFFTNSAHGGIGQNSGWTTWSVDFFFFFFAASAVVVGSVCGLGVFRIHSRCLVSNALGRRSSVKRCRWSMTYLEPTRRVVDSRTRGGYT